MRNRLLRNTATLLIGSGGGALLSFLLSVLIGRGLGDAALGIYAAALAWVFPLNLLAEFGLGTLITRAVAADPTLAGSYLRAAIRARLALGGGLTVALLLAAPLLSADPRVMAGVQISAPLVLIGPLFSTYSALFRARRVMWPVAALGTGMLAIQVALTALALALGGDVGAALWVNLITSAGQLAAARLIWRRWFADGGAAVPVDVRALLRRAGPFAIAGMLAALHLRAGLILLEMLVGVDAAGVYTAALRFIEAFNLSARAFFDSLFPLLAGLSAARARLDAFFGRVAVALIVAALPGGIALALAAPALIEWTYGPAFAPAGPVLQVAALSLLPGLLKGARTVYWYARGREGWVNAVAAATLVLRIGLSLWWIPMYGPVGAALAHLAVETASALLLFAPPPFSRSEGAIP